MNSFEKPFIILSFERSKRIADKLKQAGHNVENEAKIIEYLVALARFLEAHHLSTRKLLDGEQLIGGKQFALCSSDLTPQGMAVLRGGFGAWEKRGYPPNDLRPLEKALEKIKKTIL